MTIYRHNMRNNISHRSRMPTVLPRSRSGSSPQTFYSTRSNTSSVGNIQSVPGIAAKFNTSSPNYIASADHITPCYPVDKNSSSVSNYPFNDGMLSSSYLTCDSTLSRSFSPGGRSRSIETLSSNSLSHDARDSHRNLLPGTNNRSRITNSVERSARSNSLPRYSAYGSLTGSRFDEGRSTAEPFSTNISTEGSNVASIRPNRWSTYSASSRVRSPSPISYQTLRTKQEFDSLPSVEPSYRTETSRVRSANLLSRGPARGSGKTMSSRTRSLSPVNRRRIRTRRSFEPHISNTFPANRNGSFIVDETKFPRQSHWVEGTGISLPSRICQYEPFNPVSPPSKEYSSSRSLIPSRTSSHERFKGGIADDNYPLSTSRRSDYADGLPSSFKSEVKSASISPPRTYGSPETHFAYHKYDKDKTYKSDSTWNLKLSNNEPFMAIQHSIENIHVTDIDCHVSENARAHHNERFSSLQEPMLIVRRGQSFRITLLLNKRFSVPKHTLALTFTTGQKPQPGKGTYVELHYPSGKPQTENWVIKQESDFGDRLTIGIEPSADSVIGEWKLSASVIDEDGKRSVSNTVTLVILFNPWCQEDSVYFPDSEKLAEYILNDSGCIFTGTQDQIVARPWFYGQFESGVLEAALDCLAKYFNFQYDRASGNPVRVVRAIGNIINSKNNKEFLHTDRDLYGNYATSSLSWIGSSILRQFLKTKAPVQYGYCFAGVLTTICRALGIPCRTVTNFNSAVGSDGTTDVCWDTTNNTDIEALNTDPVWTFHVWNEVYMKRRDLPAGYDGWQAIQVSPQESSGGDVCYGPAPLFAILSGKTDVMYDVGFIYDQLNSDRVHWGRGKDGCWNLISIEKAIFGKRLSTKTPDGQAIPTNFTDCEKIREDITNQYKVAEGNALERVSLLSPPSRVAKKRHIFAASNDIECKLLTPKEGQVGEDFDLVIVLTNASGVAKQVCGRLLCNVTTHTGKELHKIKNETFSKVVEPYEKEEITIHVTVDDYAGQVGEAENIRVALFGKSEDWKTQFAKLENFKLKLPRLILKVRDKFVHVKSPVQLTITFANPLKSKSLTNCHIFLEGNGINEPRGHFTRNVVASETFQQTLTVTPTSKGCCTIFVTFCCDQLSDINGNTDIFVQ